MKQITIANREWLVFKFQILHAGGIWHEIKLRNVSYIGITVSWAAEPKHTSILSHIDPIEIRIIIMTSFA